MFCYGSYERAFLKRMRKRAKRKELVDRVLKSLVNILSLVYAHLYFPCLLQRPEGRRRLTWAAPGPSRTPRASRASSGGARWEATQDEEWKQKLADVQPGGLCGLEAGDGVRCIRRQCRGLQPRSAVRRGRKRPARRLGRGARQAGDGQPQVGKINFFHPDYEYINDCAYFDYQRQRVYVRTSKVAEEEPEEAEEDAGTGTLRVSQRVQIIELGSAPRAAVRDRPDGNTGRGQLATARG